ncbi:helix-turn-helix domain-containing protein [Nocardioides sp.]|uniref:winged helix-turn-helix transcriptional regulator n=1 Tax=Nocardioides sp. TaxID=35761 RepID=UPI002C298D11|nr:helix-turn-helix domain-containing protein [Nocardioides sp.]HXH80291.1 helix-turn-helix domain-containing protein [Nocardioides sp.]
MSDTTERLVLTQDHREILGQVFDKWSMLILEELCEEPRRFNELRRLMPVTQKSLTTTLRRLERSGIVERVVVSDRPIAVEYRITTLGKTLREPVEAILRWSDDHLDAIRTAQADYDETLDQVPVSR